MAPWLTKPRSTKESHRSFEPQQALKGSHFIYIAFVSFSWRSFDPWKAGTCNFFQQIMTWNHSNYYSVSQLMPNQGISNVRQTEYLRYKRTKNTEERFFFLIQHASKKCPTLLQNVFLRKPGPVSLIVVLFLTLVLFQSELEFPHSAIAWDLDFNVFCRAPFLIIWQQIFMSQTNRQNSSIRRSIPIFNSS